MGKIVYAINNMWVCTAGQKIKKSPGQKKLVKSNKINFMNLFLPNSIFCNFKNGQKSIFELGKSLKLPKMQFLVIFLPNFDGKFKY